MLSNYLKIAWRSILRDKSFSLINVGGLAIGIAACLLILQYVAYERSYDRFHQNASQIYRVKQDRYEKGVLATEWAGGAYAIGNTMKLNFPEIEAYVKLTGVFKNFPANTHLKSDMLVSFETFNRLVNPDNVPDRSPDNAWNWDGCLTYLLLSIALLTVSFQSVRAALINPAQSLRSE